MVVLTCYGHQDYISLCLPRLFEHHMVAPIRDTHFVLFVHVETANVSATYCHAHALTVCYTTIASLKHGMAVMRWTESKQPGVFQGTAL